MLARCHGLRKGAIYTADIGWVMGGVKDTASIRLTPFKFDSSPRSKTVSSFVSIYTLGK